MIFLTILCSSRMYQNFRVIKENFQDIVILNSLPPSFSLLLDYLTRIKCALGIVARFLARLDRNRELHRSRYGRDGNTMRRDYHV